MSLAIHLNKEKRISWTDFQANFLSKEDAFRYEWLNGIVEKTSRELNVSWFYIYRNIQNEIDETGLLFQNVNVLFQKNHRKLDMAYFTNEQIDKMAWGESQIPKFIIEIISDHDLVDTFNKKMVDYRKSGVELVWRIYPKTKEVHVYFGENLKDISVCFENDICFANSIFPLLKMSVNDVFKVKK